ncbi:MAG: hypothetical protein LGR52_07230, partial [Candidatus Thiosymbion ectosymbiont of Robbea hypermnestra]|nr:hypothetical protein [Candidatus Thiosymbion ectosymbiont of Robbea hypermnestra]
VARACNRGSYSCAHAPRGWPFLAALRVKNKVKRGTSTLLLVAKWLIVWLIPAPSFPVTLCVLCAFAVKKHLFTLFLNGS